MYGESASNPRIMWRSPLRFESGQHKVTGTTSRSKQDLDMKDLVIEAYAGAFNLIAQRPGAGAASFATTGLPVVQSVLSHTWFRCSSECLSQPPNHSRNHNPSLSLCLMHM